MTSSTIAQYAPSHKAVQEVLSITEQAVASLKLLAAQYPKDDRDTQAMIAVRISSLDPRDAEAKRVLDEVGYMKMAHNEATYTAADLIEHLNRKFSDVEDTWWRDVTISEINRIQQSHPESLPANRWLCIAYEAAEGSPETQERMSTLYGLLMSLP